MCVLDRCPSLWHLALVETHRRGNETTRSVCAVSEGMEWVQDFVDLGSDTYTAASPFPPTGGSPGYQRAQSPAA